MSTALGWDTLHFLFWHFSQRVVGLLARWQRGIADSGGFDQLVPFLGNRWRWVDGGICPCMPVYGLVSGR